MIECCEHGDGTSAVGDERRGGGFGGGADLLACGGVELLDGQATRHGDTVSRVPLGVNARGAKELGKNRDPGLFQRAVP